jgi:hypothetical protein
MRCISRPRRVSASGLCVYKTAIEGFIILPSSQSLRPGTLSISYSCSFRPRRVSASGLCVYHIHVHSVLAESPPWDFEHILFMFIQVHILFPSKEYQAYSATVLPNNNNHSVCSRFAISNRYRRIYNPSVLAESPPRDSAYIIFMFIPSSQSLRPGTLSISYSCSFKSIFYSRQKNIKHILQRRYLTIIITSVEILPS